MTENSGQEDAAERFEVLCMPFKADLFRFLFWMCRDRTLAEDVVQETLLRAWRSLGSLESRDAVKKPWLLTIARRELARTFERKRLETLDIDTIVQSESPALAASDTQEVDEMRLAILQLEPAYREPLILQVLMGYSTQEIADQLGTTQGAVLTRLFRARHELRKWLTGSNAGGDFE